MKNKKIEKLFLDYMTNLANDETDSQVAEDTPMWLLFGEEDFHINRKNNTLYVKPIDILIEHIFNEKNVLDGKVQWVGYQHNALTLQHTMAVGVDNPFTNSALTSLVTHNPVVRAIPYRYAIKMHNHNKH